jgi:hypothetical protein
LGGFITSWADFISIGILTDKFDENALLTAGLDMHFPILYNQFSILRNKHLSKYLLLYTAA